MAVGSLVESDLSSSLMDTLQYAYKLSQPRDWMHALYASIHHCLHFPSWLVHRLDHGNHIYLPIALIIPKLYATFSRR